MTVTSTSPAVRYNYTGPGDYSFAFRVFTANDLEITHIDESGTVALMRLGFEYTVSLVEGVDGGVVHMTYDLKTGGTLEIRRVLPVTQDVDWVNHEPLDAETLEDSFDKLTMIVQQMDVTVTEGSQTTNWRGDWVSGGVVYYVQDLVTAPNSNMYTCLVEHASSSNFDADLAAGYWSLVIDVEKVTEEADRAEAEADRAEQEADNAAASAAAAANSASEAANSATDAENSKDAAAISETNAANSEINAANCAVDSFDSATEATAARDKAYQWAEEAEDVEVEPGEYSAHHWAIKAADAVGGGGLHNTLPDLQGGTDTPGAEYFHITQQQHTDLISLLGLGFDGNHNNLSNIQGGSATERYHLLLVEQQWVVNNYLKTIYETHDALPGKAGNGPEWNHINDTELAGLTQILTDHPGGVIVTGIPLGYIRGFDCTTQGLVDDLSIRIGHGVAEVNGTEVEHADTLYTIASIPGTLNTGWNVIGINSAGALRMIDPFDGTEAIAYDPTKRGWYNAAGDYRYLFEAALCFYWTGSAAWKTRSYRGFCAVSDKFIVLNSTNPPTTNTIVTVTLPWNNCKVTFYSYVSSNGNSLTALADNFPTGATVAQYVSSLYRASDAQDKNVYGRFTQFVNELRQFNYKATSATDLVEFNLTGFSAPAISDLT